MGPSREARHAAALAKVRFELEGLAARGVVMAGNAFSSVLLLKGERFTEFTELMQKLCEPLPERGVEAWNADMKERWNRGYVLETFQSPTKVMEEDPRLGAAKWLNKFVTACHYHFYTEVMKRAVDGVIDDAPEDLHRIAKAYNDRPIPPELQ